MLSFTASFVPFIAPHTRAWHWPWDLQLQTLRLSVSQTLPTPPLPPHPCFLASLGSCRAVFSLDLPVSSMTGSFNWWLKAWASVGSNPSFVLTLRPQASYSPSLIYRAGMMKIAYILELPS